MRDPNRLLSGDGSAFEQRLLDAGKHEAMPEALKLRMEQGLGLGGGSGATAGSATAAAGAKASLLVWTSAGLVALAVAFGGGVLGGRLSARPAAPVAAAPVAPVATAPHSPAVPSQPTPEPVEMAVVKRLAQARKAPARPVASLRGDLRAEIALIDAAREALQMRSAGEALEILRRYANRFPRGTFAPEAAALRIEALEQSGAHREAQAQAREFVATHPDSPLAERINRLAR